MRKYRTATNRYRAHASTRRPGSVHTQMSFCENNGISLSKYFQLKREGRGPVEIKIDQRVIITEEAERDWRKAMEIETARKRLAQAQEDEKRATAHKPTSA